MLFPSGSRSAHRRKAGSPNGRGLFQPPPESLFDHRASASFADTADDMIARCPGAVTIGGVLAEKAAEILERKTQTSLTRHIAPSIGGDGQERAHSWLVSGRFVHFGGFCASMCLKSEKAYAMFRRARRSHNLLLETGHADSTRQWVVTDPVVPDSTLQGHEPSPFRNPCRPSGNPHRHR